MFKQAVDAVRQMLFLLRDTEQNKQDIAALKEQLNETNEMMRQIAFELQRRTENEKQEREKFILRVENMLLRERQYLTSRRSKKRK
jgi:hypothetical protein